MPTRAERLMIRLRAYHLTPPRLLSRYQIQRAQERDRVKLAHTWNWYVENYKVPLSTLRRHRELMDKPYYLWHALHLRYPLHGFYTDVSGLVRYLHAHPELIPPNERKRFYGEEI